MAGSSVVSPTVTVGRLFERMKAVLQLEQLTAVDGAEREIRSPNLSSPGLALSGYFDRFPGRRIQVLGQTEIMYLESITAAERQPRFEKMLSYPVPCVIVTKGLKPPRDVIEVADRMGIPVFSSHLKTAELYTRLNPWLDDEFAPATSLHGSLADVFGVGLLFMGKSGIGKSECVLDLVERGHRVVADDLVLVRRRGTDVLIGRGHELQRHYMEIRGVGLVDIPSIFGIRAVRQQKRIEVIVNLAEWRQGEPVERTGLDGETMTILDVEIPKITVPLNPGKNITVIAEVIAMNHLLKYSGIEPAQRFNDRLVKHMRAAADVHQYLQQDNE